MQKLRNETTRQLNEVLQDLVGMRETVAKLQEENALLERGQLSQSLDGVFQFLGQLASRVADVESRVDEKSDIATRSRRGQK